MRKFSYWLCFSLVAIPFALSISSWLLAKIGVNLHGIGLLHILGAFRNLIPGLLAHLFPNILHITLSLVMLALVIRRVWLTVARRSNIPHSFQGLAKVLAYIGTVSFTFGLTVLVLSAVFRWGSGAPAGLLMLPATFCFPWAFFLTEVQSLRATDRGNILPKR